MQHYDVYENGELICENKTCGQVSEITGIDSAHVWNYAEYGICRYKRYMVAFTGEPIAQCRSKDKEPIEFKRLWQKAVAPFKKVAWSRTEGKKLHIKKQDER